MDMIVVLKFQYLSLESCFQASMPASHYGSVVYFTAKMHVKEPILSEHED